MRESGAAGAVMIALVKHGVYDSIKSCTDTWLANKLGEIVTADESLVPLYDTLFNTYLSSREGKVSQGIWQQLAAASANNKQR